MAVCAGTRLRAKWDGLCLYADEKDKAGRFGAIRPDQVVMAASGPLPNAPNRCWIHQPRGVVYIPNFEILKGPSPLDELLKGPSPLDELLAAFAKGGGEGADQGPGKASAPSAEGTPDVDARRDIGILKAEVQSLKQGLARHSTKISCVEEYMDMTQSLMIETLRDEIVALKDRVAKAEHDAFEMKTKLDKGVEAIQGLGASDGESLSALRADLNRLDKKPSFWTLYQTYKVPDSLVVLQEAVRTFITACACDLEPAPGALQDYIRRLDSSMVQGSEASGLGPVQHASARLWTTEEELVTSRGSLTVYGSLTRACRDDMAPLLQQGGIALLKGLNTAVVRRGKPLLLQTPATWNRKSFRGAGIHPEQVAFWSGLLQGTPRVYRAPMPLASSLKESVADFFLDRVPADQTKVKFELAWPAERCVHAAFVDGISACRGEAEMVLAPYSVLEVTDFDDSREVVKIGLRVAADNKAHAEYLPSTSWH